MTPIEPSSEAPPTGLTAGRNRRGIRKGTRSCWECKRRKSRCTFDKSDSSCTECLRKGVVCVSQDLPEETARPSIPLQPIYDRLGRVEQILELVAERTGAVPSHQPDCSSTIQARRDHPIGIEQSFQNNNHESIPVIQLPRQRNDFVQGGPAEKHVTIHTQEGLPTPADIHLIFDLVSQDSIFFHQMMAMPYAQLASPSFRAPESLIKLPEEAAHPILIAKDLLILATLLQGLKSQYEKQIPLLSTTPETMMTRLMQVAASLMPAQDDSITSMEALECILLEGVFYANGGNLRRAWLTYRRLISVAQLLDLHRPDHCNIQFLDPTNNAEPRFVWFRILYIERLLCLLLGKPMCSVGFEAVNDASWLEDEHPLQKLERMHYAIASRILSRNESYGRSRELEATRAIDHDLQNATAMLPQHWWSIPNLSNISDSSERFWAAVQLSTQLFHHHLVVQLHLPFLSKPSAEQKYDHNKIICINSSREILTRFIAFRSLDTVAFNCRAIDFFALIATVAILLAHISSRCTCQRDDILAHQRLSDRTLVEQALNNMDEANRLCSDMMYEKNANVLRRMLDAENCAYGRHMGSEKFHDDHTSGKQLDPKQPTILVCLPHFGQVQITCSGVIRIQQLPDSTLQMMTGSFNSPLAGYQNNAGSVDMTSSYNGVVAPGVGMFSDQAFETENPYLIETAGMDLSVSNEQSHYGVEYTACMRGEMFDDMDQAIL